MSPDFALHFGSFDTILYWGYVIFFYAKTLVMTNYWFNIVTPNVSFFPLHGYCRLIPQPQTCWASALPLSYIFSLTESELQFG